MDFNKRIFVIFQDSNLPPGAAPVVKHLVSAVKRTGKHLQERGYLSDTCTNICRTCMCLWMCGSRRAWLLARSCVSLLVRHRESVLATALSLEEHKSVCSVSPQQENHQRKCEANSAHPSRHMEEEEDGDASNHATLKQLKIH